MGFLFVNTGGAATNSGSSDNSTPDKSGTNASVSGTTVTLDSGTVLTGVVTSGASQSSINIAGATNTNQTIFWITGTAGSGGATPTVTVSVAPTGTLTGVSWAIGGQYLYPSGATHDVIVNALRAGDTLQFDNTPASKTLAFINPTTAGDTTSGKISVIGKAGASVTLAVTGATNAITIGQANWYFSNLTFTGSGNAPIVTASAGGFIFENNSISGTGVNASQQALVVTGNGFVVLNNNIGPTGSIGVNPQSSTGQGIIFGNYIHDNTGDGITMGGTPSFAIINNIVTGNGGVGINFTGATASQAHSATVYGNTVYGNTGSQVSVTNINTVVFMCNNIISNASAANLAAWPTGGADLVSKHKYNVYYSSSSGANVNLTPGTTESTANPVFSNVAGGNYAVSATGSAGATGFPGTMPGGFSAGFNNIGALQNASVAAAAGGIISG